ncbi:MAG TPA: SDR family oxidoreductase [Pseudolysinimonas sp.]|jgi:putative NADH-flavin reductase
MKIALFGANGGTGRVLTAQALDAGHEVTAVTRHPETFGLAHERLRVVAGDALDLAAVSAAVAGQDAVLSTLGVPFGKDPITIYSVGTGNIVSGMTEHGVRRLACVSSSAVDVHPDPTETWLFEKVLQPYVVNGIGKTTYDDMRAMEATVAASALDWTVVRPSGLFTAEVVSDYRVSATDHLSGRYTSRADLADFLLRLAAGSEFVRETPEVRTTDGTPNFFAFMWNETIKKKP